MRMVLRTRAGSRFGGMTEKGAKTAPSSDASSCSLALP